MIKKILDFLFFFSIQKTLQSSWITGQNAWRYFFNILREKIAFFPCQMIVWIKTRFFPGHSMSTFCGFFSASHDDKDIHQILAHMLFFTWKHTKFTKFQNLLVINYLHVFFALAIWFLLKQFLSTITKTYCSALMPFFVISIISIRRYRTWYFLYRVFCEFQWKKFCLFIIHRRKNIWDAK